MKHPPSFSGDCLASCIQNNLPTDITAYHLHDYCYGSHYSALRQKRRQDKEKLIAEVPQDYIPQTVPTTKIYNLKG